MAVHEIRPRLEMEQEYFTEMALQESRRWIEEVTGKQFRYPDDPRRSLQSGILLCELLMALKPGCIRKVNRLPTPVAHLDNMTVFQNACREHFGLQDCQLFDIRDLEDLRLRVVIESDEAEEELRCETYKRLKKVVVTIFWLAKVIRSWYRGPALDMAVFSSLVDAPPTPLYQSNRSTPTGSTNLFPALNDGAIPHHSPSAVSADWTPIKSNRFDSLDRSSAYGSMPRSGDNTRPTSRGSGEPFDDDSTGRAPSDDSYTSSTVVSLTSQKSQIAVVSSDRQPRTPPVAKCEAKSPIVTNGGRVQPVPNRQVSSPIAAPQKADLTRKPSNNIATSPPIITADPLHFVKPDTSPLSEDARHLMDQLQRQKQQQRWEDEHGGDNWQENLSSWKSRRISQKKSVSDNDGDQNRIVVDEKSVTAHSGRPEDDLEGSVLAAFGFLRDMKPGVSTTERQQKPSAPCRDPASPNDSVFSSSQVVQTSAVSPTNQRPGIGSQANRKTDFIDAGAVSNSNKVILKSDLTEGDSVQSTRTTQRNEIKLVFDRPIEFGRDLTLSGGREFMKPITVDLVVKGSAADLCGLSCGDELLAVNGASLENHYVESVVAVINQGVCQGPVEVVVRRSNFTQNPDHSPDGSPPPLPASPPPPLPAALPPDTVGFHVDGDDWSFIDDEFSRDLDNILEEEGICDLETDASSRTGAANVRAASLRNRCEFLGISPEVSEELRVVVTDTSDKSGEKVDASHKLSSADERIFAVVSVPKTSATKDPLPTNHSGPQEKFDREQEELKLKQLQDLERARRIEEEKRKEEKELLSKELAVQTQLDEVAKKRQEELKSNLRKAGIKPLEAASSQLSASSPEVEVAADLAAELDNFEQTVKGFDSEPAINKTETGRNALPSITVAAVPESTQNTEASAPECDLITAEVQFTQVMPQVGSYEVLLTDSDDYGSSESGTPVPHRLQYIRDDVGRSHSSSPSTTHSSRSPMNVVEVSEVKSEDASEWRKMVLQASKPRPSGWFWQEKQNAEGAGSDSEHDVGLEGDKGTMQDNARVLNFTDNAARDAWDSADSSRVLNSNSGISSFTVTKTTSNVQPLSVDTKSTKLFVDHTNARAPDRRTVPAKPLPPPRIDSMKSPESPKSPPIMKSGEFGRMDRTIPDGDFTTNPSNKAVTVSESHQVIQVQRPSTIPVSDVKDDQAAVDMLYSYHQMLPFPGVSDVRSSTSSINSRCSPALMSQASPTSPEFDSEIQRTHF